MSQRVIRSTGVAARSLMRSLRARLGGAGYRAAWILLRGWWALGRPRSSGVRCVLRRGDAVLLVRHTYGDRRWMLPGGRVRRREMPLAAAQREMRQELGAAFTDWKTIGCLPARTTYLRRSRDDAFRRHTTHYLQATATRDHLQPRAIELRDVGWFDINALPDDRSDALDVARQAGWL